MRKFRTCLMTLGFCLAVCSFSEAAASDPYYLNGDKNYPMIQNTGGIYNDGTTGLSGSVHRDDRGCLRGRPCSQGQAHESCLQ